MYIWGYAQLWITLKVTQLLNIPLHSTPMQVSCCYVEALLEALVLPALSNSKILHSCFSLWWYQTRNGLNWLISKDSVSFWLAHSCKCSHQPFHTAVTICFSFRTQDSALGDENIAGLCQECQLHLESSWLSPDDHLVAPQLLLSLLVWLTWWLTLARECDCISTSMVCPKFSVRAQQYCSTCPICLVHNIRWRVKAKDAAHLDTWVSFVNLQVDFMQMSKQCNYKYTCLIINFLSGWVKVCPCRNADATTVTKKLFRQFIMLEEICLRIILAKLVE